MELLSDTTPENELLSQAFPLLPDIVETTPTIIWGVYESRVKIMFYIITFWGFSPAATLFFLNV